MTKDLVLAMLISSGECVSGESISKKIGVSRTAINAAVKALRQDGYVIGSSTKTGYTLTHSPDRLCASELLARLGEKRMERVICLDSADSTNTRLKALAEDGAASGTAVLANGQSAGRGRAGRSFLSPQGDGVYMSVLLRPDCGAEEASQFTAWAAVAARRAINRVSGADCGIKWVNDLVLGGRKLAGILTEVSIEGESSRLQYMVVGVGVNVNQKSFPEELSELATSLYMSTGRRISRCELAAELVRELDRAALEFPGEREAYLSEYRAACVNPGRAVSFDMMGESRLAVASAIDDSFGLKVTLADGTTQLLRSGEVSVRGMYGYV